MFVKYITSACAACLPASCTHSDLKVFTTKKLISIFSFLFELSFVVASRTTSSFTTTNNNVHYIHTYIHVQDQRGHRGPVSLSFSRSVNLACLEIFLTTTAHLLVSKRLAHKESSEPASAEPLSERNKVAFTFYLHSNT